MSQRQIGERPGTQTFLNILGVLFIVLGILATLLGFADTTMNSIGPGIGVALSGFIFLAFAKVIDLLCEISDNTRPTGK